MTTALQEAVAEVEKLPPDEQDAIAARLRAEVADEERWSASFLDTTDKQWELMAEAVRREIRAGNTAALDDVFPPARGLA